MWFFFFLRLADITSCSAICFFFLLLLSSVMLSTNHHQNWALFTSSLQPAQCFLKLQAQTAECIHAFNKSDIWVGQAPCINAVIYSDSFTILLVYFCSIFQCHNFLTMESRRKSGFSTSYWYLDYGGQLTLQGLSLNTSDSGADDRPRGSPTQSNVNIYKCLSTTLLKTLLRPDF